MVYKIASLIIIIALSTWAALPAANGWYAIPNTKISNVCACTQGFPEVCGVEGCPAITADWNSGVFDTKRNRLIVWGGGHNGYYGNEIYALNLNNLTMTRLNDPTLPIAVGCAEVLLGATPNSRHTNDGIVYMDHADKMFVQGGMLACLTSRASKATWIFDFATEKWEYKRPAGILPMGPYINCAYDAVSKKVFVHDGTGLFCYTLETNTYDKLASNMVESGYTKTAILDPKQKKFFIFGSGESSVWDISAGSNFAKQSFSTSGGGAITGAYAPGLTYDPVGEKIIGWSGGSTVYSLNVASRTWSAATYSGGPGSQEQWGTYKRCGYSTAFGVFVVYNHTNQNGYAFRFPGTDAQRANLPANIQRLSVWPNPFGKTAVQISVKGALAHDMRRASVNILDLQGKIIRALTPLAAGNVFTCTWDGKDQSKNKIPAGIYLVRPNMPGFKCVKQILLLK